MFANSLGHMLAGVGGGIASIDNRPLTGSVMVEGVPREFVYGGALGWYYDAWAVISTQLLPAPAGWDDPAGLSIIAIHKDTGNVVVLAKRGCSFGLADGGAWVAFDGGDPQRGIPPYGLFSSSGWYAPTSFPAALSSDGAICYNVQGTYALRVRDAGGSHDWGLSPSTLYSVQLLTGGRAVAMTPDFGVFVHGLTPPLTVVARVRDPKLVEGLPEPWITYWDDEHSRHLLHPWNSPYGYVVQSYAAEGPSWGFTARAVNGRVVCGWSNVEGQQPGHTITRTIDLSSPRVDLRVPTQPPVIPPVEPPVIPPVEPPVNSIDCLAINEEVRAKWPRAKPGYPNPLGADHCWYLVELAQRTGTLLFEKPDGDHVFIPQVNKYVNMNIVGRGTMGNTYADTLRDAEGDAEPVWQVASPADGVYIDVRSVVIPGGPVVPPIEPPVQPPTPCPPCPECPDLMANPTYDAFIKGAHGAKPETVQFYEVYAAKYGRAPAPNDYGHFTWIRLREFVPLDVALAGV